MKFNFSWNQLLNFLFVLTLFFKPFSSEAQTAVVPTKMDWWKNAKFGMFMHWGLYSQTAGFWEGRKAKGSEHFMLYERIPLKTYAKIADDFNPVNYNASKWVLSAKNAGMNYLVITTKHHDGFAMFDSPSNDYNIKKRTPYGKDPMIDLANACHKYNVKLGFYYSLGRDWQDPDVPTNWPTKGGRSNTWDYPDEDAKVFHRYFERKVKPQVKELLTQYGKVDILWFDTPELISKAESEELRQITLSLQPNCIVNNRIGNNLGDYQVLEQEISNKIIDCPWEACITMSRNWGYVAYDTLYKSPELLVRQLLEVVSKGGNLLLDIGPTAKGEFTNQAQLRFQQIGKWMKKNSEGIYETHPWKVANEVLTYIPEIKKETTDSEMQIMKDAVNDATSKMIIPEIRFTAKRNNIYAYVCSWNGNDVLIKSLAKGQLETIQKVDVLGAYKQIKWKQTSKGLLITMPTYTLKEIPVIGFRIKIKK